MPQFSRSDGGGGGERVLWVMIHGLLSPLVKSRENPEVICSIPDKYHAEIVIYSGETHRTKEQILDNVEVKIYFHFHTKKKIVLRRMHFVRFIFFRKSLVFYLMRNKRRPFELSTFTLAFY